MKISAIISILSALVIAAPAFAEVKTKAVDYEHDGAKLKGYLAFDATLKGPRPGVLLFHEWWGHNDYIEQRAREFAELGYVAFAADMYGAGIETKDHAEAGKLSKPFYDDRTLMQNRAKAALEQLIHVRDVDSSRIAALGFCFGGTVALEMARARAPIAAAIVFHGGLSTPHHADKIQASILVLNGADDPLVKPNERFAFMDEMRYAHADWQFVEYGNAVHAFTNPNADSFKINGVAYNQTAEIRSLALAKQFLAEKLGTMGLKNVFEPGRSNSGSLGR